jgi:hypothetical protein
MTANLEKVLLWASCTTGEGRSFNEGYYWTIPVKSALFRLTRYESYFIGLIGLVGTGKSSAIGALEAEVSSIVHDRSTSIADVEVQKEKERRIEENEPDPSYLEALAIRERYCKRVLAVKWQGDLWTTFHDCLIGTTGIVSYKKKAIDNAVKSPKALKQIKRIEDGFKGRSLADNQIHERAIE